ncbi:hypothetical protein ACFYKX_14065 [Cytobacillus sp. FJAT-54145]|uniref:HTH cro/C1-type domain-containing protein n=1 Tax=Cytobacillus spartinae TaxID=3299023 RepID=A0ABW6KC18_9BACI
MSIEEYNFGEALSSLRKMKGVSTEDLAEGICTEEDLILFEKELKYPTIKQVHDLARKLHIDLRYLYDMATKSRDNYSVAIMEIINRYKRERDYQTIYNIIQKEKENPLFKITALQQFLLWHEGICIYYLESNIEAAIDKFDQAIILTNPLQESLTEREVEVLTSKGIIYKEEERYKEAIAVFKDALTNIENLPYLIDKRVLLKVLFGLTQVLTEEGQYAESLTYSMKGLNLCLHDEQLFLLAEFHYQTGENYIKLGNKEEGKQYIEKSIEILLLEKNEKFATLFKKELDKLLIEC